MGYEQSAARTILMRKRRQSPGQERTGFVLDDAAEVFRPWGSMRTLGRGPGYQIKQLVVQPGQRLSLQKHRHRAEHWVVVAGSPHVVSGETIHLLRRRQCVVIPRQTWHRIENRGRTPVVIIELQHGVILSEGDIIRKQDDYGRVGQKSQQSRASKRLKGEDTGRRPIGQAKAGEVRGQKASRSGRR